MAATTTPSINSLVHKLHNSYPALTFTPGSPCRWSPETSTIFFDPKETADNKAELLHELAHALLSHGSFERDIELLQKEREAWQYALTELSPRFNVPIDPCLIDDRLDTYRDWLHERSLCPRCQQTGLQTKTKTYSCINCRSSWRVNDARQCQQRRWTISS